MTNQTIIVYFGIICKWESLKNIIDEDEVEFATSDEVRNYYMLKLR